MIDPEYREFKKTRIILITSIVLFIVLFSSIVAFLSIIIVGTYQTFEENEMNSRMHRFQDALNNSMNILENTAIDYGEWDATARYIEGKYPQFVEAEISDETFRKMGINFVGFFDLKGTPFYYIDLSMPPEKGELINPALQIYLPHGNNTPDGRAPLPEKKKIVFSNGDVSGILIFVPIIYHTQNSSPVGTVVMGRYFADPFLDEISLVLKKRIEIIPEKTGSKLFPGNSQSPEIRVITESNSEISAYLKIPDKQSGQQVVFGVTYPRDIYQQGISTLGTFLSLIAFVMMVFTGLTGIGLSYYIRHAEDVQKLAKKKDESYHQIINNLEDAYFRADPNGILEMVSPSAARMLGYSNCDELIGVRIADLFQNPDERPALRAILFENYQIQNNTIALKRKDGSITFASIHAHLIISDKGIVTGMEGTAHDRTEIILAGKDSLERQSVYRMIFDSANIGLFQSSPEGQFLSVNPTFASMLGYENPEQLRQSVQNIPRDLFVSPEEGKEIVESLLQESSLENREIQLRKKDGSLIWLNINIVLIRDIKEQPAALFGTAIDITERRHAEYELKESQQKFKSLFYLSPIAIMVYDQDGHLNDANSAAISIFGVSDAGVLNSDSLFDHPLLTTEERRAIINGRSVDTDLTVDFDLMRSRFRFPSSRIGTGHLRMIVSPVPHPSIEGVNWYLTQIIDVTDRKKAEIGSQISEQKYRQVFANVSHGLILFELFPEGEPGKILDMNLQAEKLIGRSLSDILTDQDILGKYLNVEELNLGEATQSDAGEICTIEIDLTSVDDKVIPVFVTCVLFLIGEQRVGLTIIEDITQKRKYEEERGRMIQQIEKNLAELATLNDGIKNPLTVITLVVDELEESIAGPVLTQVRAINHLIDKLDKRWVESEKILQFLRKHNYLQAGRDDYTKK
nr:PAS domain S-box protein [uncultured Methanospirillum sp.]